MAKIWEFFENMDEQVYVCDADTYELIYLNRKAREIYAVPTLSALRGMKCYETLHNSARPCSFCSKAELRPGQFKEWRYYNPTLKKHLAVKDTIVEEDGRRCVLEIVLDVENLSYPASNPYDGSRGLDALVNEGLRLALRETSPDRSVQVILEYIGNALGGERTYIFERNAWGGDDNTYEWTARGVAPEQEHLQNLSGEVWADWYQQFNDSRNIVIADLEEVRSSAPMQYEILKRRGVRSLVAVPLYSSRRVIGFYGIDNSSSSDLDYAANMLQIMGHFIVSSLRRRDLVRQLQRMSYHDQLTQAGNRHALREYLKHLRQEESLGLVYCDVTGLKRINDTQGHEAGDRLIMNACACLQRAFGKNSLFRIGGDELVVLMPDCTELDLAKRVEVLRDEMQARSVVMALGAVWEPNNTRPFNQLLSEAEQLMYWDKADYYRRMGIDRRTR